MTMLKILCAVLAIAACGGKQNPNPGPTVDESGEHAETPPDQGANMIPPEKMDEDTKPEEGVTIINAHGHMEKEAIEAGLQPHQQELMDCYLKKVGRRRWLGGHVKIHWDIKKDGTITKVVLSSESDLGSWPIEKCLLEVARSASFDKPIGGDADFDLPLALTPKAPPP